MRVTVKNSDEHMWKHISGRKFLNVLEEKETGKITSNGGKEMKYLKEVETKKGQRRRRRGLRKHVLVEKVPKDDESLVEENSEPEKLDFWISSW